jgi:hypothetical protein
MAAILSLADWHLPGPSVMLLALVVASLVVVALAARRPAAYAVSESSAGTHVLREHAVLGIRLRDPDAAGRPRPRAP